jgi:hypothetical protein
LADAEIQAIYNSGTSGVCTDITPPADGLLTASSASSTQIDLNWTAATDVGSGLASSNTYKLVRATGTTAPSDCSGTAVYQGTAQSFSNTGLTTGTQYAYRVCSYDAAGNVSTGATAGALTFTTNFNATSDFSFSDNPNGVWSYGWMPVGFGALTLDTVPAWCYASNTNPCIWKNTGTSTPNGVPPGWVSLHPGPSTQPSVLRFTAPYSGNIAINGQFLAGDVGTMQTDVRVRGIEVWQQADAGSFNLTSNVTAGDTVDFAVFGGYGSGNTPLDATVSYSLSIVTPYLTAGTPGGPYSQALTSDFGTAPYTYAVTAGSLPAGVALASNGTFSGTPSSPGNYPVTITVTDTAAHTAVRSYTLVVMGGSGCAPVSSGLVGWWKGDGNADDQTGANNGALMNGASADATGKVGQAFNLDGIGSYIEKTNPASQLNIGNQSWTISSWVNSSYSGSNSQVIVSRYQCGWNCNSAPNAGAWYYLALDGNGYANFLVRQTIDNPATGTSSVAGSTDIRDGNWHLVTGVLDRTTSVQNCMSTVSS